MANPIDSEAITLTFNPDGIVALKKTLTLWGEGSGNGLYLLLCRRSKNTYWIMSST